MTEEVHVPWYWKSVDFAQLCKDYPPPPDFLGTIHRASRDELDAIQARRFLEQVKRAWEIPFYQIHWGRHGIEPGDIRSIEELDRLPPFTTLDLRESIERCPPFGDFPGVKPGEMALLLQTSGGTTGLPRPMLYAPQDREIMGIIGARRYYMQGIRPGDIVHSTYALGLGNAGITPRDVLWRWTGAIPITAGSGNQTPTKRQIELMKAWGANVLIGQAAYLRHMAVVARDEMGIDVRDFKIKCICCMIGMEDRRPLEELWGAPAYDAYGASESGMISAECVARDGQHIFEDGYKVQIVDPETQKEVPHGQRGSIYVTTLFKYAAPMIRYNSNDVSAIAPGDCSCGCTHRRIQKIFGRADNMVKIRTQNVFPEAIGGVITGEQRSTGEYFCVVEKVGEARQDQLTVLVEKKTEAVDGARLKEDLEEKLHLVLGVKVIVTPVRAGELEPHTLSTQITKPKRVIDKRYS